jgi:hypothetical protein
MEGCVGITLMDGTNLTALLLVGDSFFKSFGEAFLVFFPGLEFMRGQRAIFLKGVK